MHGSRWLNCLIEGESKSTTFPISVGHDYPVGCLKKDVKEERALDTLKDPHVLKLWKVNINLDTHDDDFFRQLKLENHEEKEMLEPWKSVLEHWKDQPPDRNHLHIIVKVPPDKKRKIAPPEITLDFGTIDKQVQAELKLLRPAVEAFLKAPELPIWDPPDNFASDIKKFITGLQIPTYTKSSISQARRVR
ncbi:hypothetical protein F5887DRAFT_1093219 [Amanita rubescens]|nr:hypothetical protein F5887DRAFT_1093219 [Amanita rubescens]